MLSLRCPRCELFVLLPTRTVGDVIICPACTSPCLLRENLVQTQPVEVDGRECFRLTFELYLYVITPEHLRELEAEAPEKALEIRRAQATLRN
jgi:hypothetical protein